MSTLRWGVVGAGWVTRDHLLPALAADPDADVAGIHDTDPHAPADCETLEALLDRRPDAVYVATPHHTHADLVAAVATRGVPVLCEKPLAHDRADARRLVAAVDDAGVLAGTAFDQRFHPAHERMAGLVADGALGTVSAVRIVHGCWLPPHWSPSAMGVAPMALGDTKSTPITGYDNWRVDPARSGGGAVLDLAPHGLDLAGRLLGEDVTTLAVAATTRVHDYPVDDGAVLAGATGGGVVYSAHVSFATPDALPRRRVEVVGTRGQLTAIDTVGQTAGGTLTFSDAATGATADVAFDRSAGPFGRQVAAFGAAVRGDAPWPYPLARDLALHELLLESLEPTEVTRCR